MAGEGYTGHINKDSLPWQFKIPFAAPDQDGAMSKEQAQKLADFPSGGVVTLGGDATGDSDENTVERIQGRSVSSATPSSGDVLVWDGSKWAPTALSSSDTFQSTFGNSLSLTAGGAFTTLGITQKNIGSSLLGVDGRLLNKAQTFSKLGVSIDSNMTLGQNLVVALQLSTDNGQTWTQVGGNAIILSNTRSVVLDFAPTVFPAGSLHEVTAILVGIGTYAGPIRITIS